MKEDIGVNILLFCRSCFIRLLRNTMESRDREGGRHGNTDIERADTVLV